MSKTVAFDLRYKDAIESGEAVVTTRNGNSVDIINWEWSVDFPILVKNHKQLHEPQLYNANGKKREFYQNYTQPRSTDLVVVFNKPTASVPTDIKLDVGLVLWTNADMSDELATSNRLLGYQKLSEPVPLTWSISDFATKETCQRLSNILKNSSCYFKSYSEELEDWAQLDTVCLRRNLKADCMFFERRHKDVPYIASLYLLVRNSSNDIILTQRIIVE